MSGRYDEIFANCAKSPGGFEHVPDRRGFWNLSREERLAFWDELYETPGFAILAGNFVEIYVDEEANREFSEYMAERIRRRVNDPEVAEQLIPKDHGFGMQRLPLETHYYEAYNRDNVQLVDITAAPIEKITPTGIRTAQGHHELDVIVYATGFDAITGPYDRVVIRGVDGEKLSERWSAGPSTYLGLLAHRFPNLLMLAGPQSASGSTNFPRAIEVGVDWVTELLCYARSNGYTRIEAQAVAERQWVEEVARSYSKLLLRKGKGWFVGYNSNVAGHEGGANRLPAYQGGAPKYTALLRQAADDGYRDIDLS